MALMAMMLDSDTCISIMKRDPHMKPQAALGDCAISQIVLGELEYGVCNSPSEAIEKICRGNGYEPSIICTPEELSEE